MSSSGRGRDQHDCGRDVGAHALGALEPHEAEAFRRHLATCAVCRDELAVLQTVVGELAMAAPQLPAPRALRRRVIARVHTEQNVSATAAGAPARRRIPRHMPRALLAAAAILLVLAALLGGTQLSSGGSSHTRVVRASVAPSDASALVRLGSGHAELVVRGMPAAPRGKIYEVWLKRARQAPTPTSALFDVTAAGAGAVAVPGDLRGVEAVLVTPEPRGGSRAPTHTPVIVARIA